MPTFDKVELSKINYGILLNDLPLITELEIDLGDWILRKATLDEISVFRPELIKFSILNFSNHVPFQEINITKSGQGFLHSPITNPEEWRYRLLVPKDVDSIPGYKLAEALRISDWDLWVELWSVKSKVNDELVDNLGGSPFQCLRILTEDSKVSVVNKTNFEQLRNAIVARSKFHDEEFPSIASALIMFREQDINRETSLKHLGYFAIIESILSHAPAANDSADSISRQLRRNLVLLNNRMPFDSNLMFDKFNGISSEKLISKLYSYRSSIAHGSNSEKELDWFYESVNSFGKETELMHKKQFMGWYLRKIVQRVLLQAILEPRLVADLKG